MKNIFKKILEWTLVVVAFALVFISLHQMGAFDWLGKP